MKWIENVYGDIINVNQISYITWEDNNAIKGYEAKVSKDIFGNDTHKAIRMPVKRLVAMVNTGGEDSPQDFLIQEYWKDYFDNHPEQVDDFCNQLNEFLAYGEGFFEYSPRKDKK